ncbi:Panacea domain-containing protein [Aminobacterium colombiense]|uniref:Prophage ps3 protein 01 n=1 Tax=Aminobacterium colombiense (strain DSM 12261 / ALA-1) TaxID=572547 RepID=D5EFE1_AMICL|nr:type II toxin-antitoxin system antitoxin SocA domain-containing protein [Aminobacterium colombiense]ADE57273.1 prophage ps3 protein 01 [Aminobacterium colombiense DSM 12261]
MASVFDVAKYILEKYGAVSAMKLQKLVYYSQAWSLVWDDDPLFDEEIEAWANGPVVRELYEKHRGIFKVHVDMMSGCSGNLTDNEKDTINIVCDFYNKKNAQELSDMTHQEGPWKDARFGLEERERGSRIISKESMAEYYSSL